MDRADSAPSRSRRACLVLRRRRRALVSCVNHARTFPAASPVPSMAVPRRAGHCCHVTLPAGPERPIFHCYLGMGLSHPSARTVRVVYRQCIHSVASPARRASRSRSFIYKGVEKRHCTCPTRLGGRGGPILITPSSRPSHGHLVPWGALSIYRLQNGTLRWATEGADDEL